MSSPTYTPTVVASAADARAVSRMVSHAATIEVIRAATPGFLALVTGAAVALLAVHAALILVVELRTPALPPGGCGALCDGAVVSYEVGALGSVACVCGGLTRPR